MLHTKTRKMGLVVGFFVLMGMVALAKAEDVKSEEESEMFGGGYSAHGWLMWSAFGVLFPAGIMMAKFGKTALSKNWFLFHRLLQVLAIVCATVGAVLAFTANSEVAGDSLFHVPLGFVVVGITWAVLLLGFIRPHKGVSWRPTWYFLHWILGTGAVALGWINLYQGLHLIAAKTFLYVALTIQVAVIGVVYMILDRWSYCLSQAQPPSDQFTKILVGV